MQVAAETAYSPSVASGEMPEMQADTRSNQALADYKGRLIVGGTNHNYGGLADADYLAIFDDPALMADWEASVGGLPETNQERDLPRTLAALVLVAADDEPARLVLPGARVAAEPIDGGFGGELAVELEVPESGVAAIVDAVTRGPVSLAGVPVDSQAASS